MTILNNNHNGANHTTAMDVHQFSPLTRMRIVRAIPSSPSASRTYYSVVGGRRMTFEFGM